MEDDLLFENAPVFEIDLGLESILLGVDLGCGFDGLLLDGLDCEDFGRSLGVG